MRHKQGISERPPARAKAATSAATAAVKAVTADVTATAGPAIKASASAHAGAFAKATAAGMSAETQATGELAAWLAKYGPVEREIMEVHERRIAGRARRRERTARAFGDLCEATEGFAAVWRREGWSLRDMVRWADGDVPTLLTLAKWLRGDATRSMDRARCRLRRPLYYAQEKARREALAKERRRVSGRRTSNPCPTRDEMLDAWMHRRESHEAAVRFGSMVHDLECYVDNSLLRDGAGAIVGRRGGVKAWLQENIPALYVRYTTVMRYKAMAKKLMQVTGLSDPVPAAAVLGRPPQWKAAAQGTSDAKADGGTPELAVVKARAVWLEVVDGVRGSATALMERLDALTDQERVDEANMLAEWRARYDNEITERMKSRWWRRMERKRDVG